MYTIPFSFPEYVKVASGLLWLFLIMLGIRWQARAFRGDEATQFRRMRWALWNAGLLILGTTLYCMLQMFDARSSMTLGHAVQSLVGVVMLCGAFMFKTWFGPILLTASVGWVQYYLFEHSEIIDPLAVFEFVVKLVESWLPGNLTYIYAGATILHALFGSLYAVSHAPDHPIVSA